MYVRNCLGGRGSMVNCLNAQVAPERAAKLVEIITYNCTAIWYS